MLNDEGQALTASKPDFLVLEPLLGPAFPGKANTLRRAVSSFIEVKRMESDRTEPCDPHETVTKLTAHMAEYGNLILTSRPFHIFSVGLAIYGTKFSVCVVDRGGVRWSPGFNMIGDCTIFVQVVRRLACDMSLINLGHDPTVTFGHGGGYNQIDYPTFTVGLGGPPPVRGPWHTQGGPLFVSASLLGRGTGVWKVIDQKGRPFILKTAWRSKSRTPESEVYTKLGAGHPGVAIWEEGGDVYVGGQPIELRRLRGSIEDNSSDLERRVLHRVIISPLGKPLWMYENSGELFEGLLSALAGTSVKHLIDWMSLMYIEKQGTDFWQPNMGFFIETSVLAMFICATTGRILCTRMARVKVLSPTLSWQHSPIRRS